METMEELQSLLEMLEKMAKSEALVVVEGKKDKAALAEFGIVRVKSIAKRALYKVVEEIALSDRKAIILTDLDKEGKRLFKILNSDLCQMGVYVDKKPREFLFKNTKLRQIEGIASYVGNLRKKVSTQKG